MDMEGLLYSSLGSTQGKKVNTACHFCDHAAQRAGRSAVALQVACSTADCRKVFCSRPACRRKLPKHLNVGSKEEFEQFKGRVDRGDVVFVCQHCENQSTCPGPQCQKRWKNKQSRQTKHASKKLLSKTRSLDSLAESFSSSASTSADEMSLFPMVTKTDVPQEHHWEGYLKKAPQFPTPTFSNLKFGFPEINLTQYQTAPAPSKPHHHQDEFQSLVDAVSIMYPNGIPRSQSFVQESVPMYAEEEGADIRRSASVGAIVFPPLTNSAHEASGEVKSEEDSESVHSLQDMMMMIPTEVDQPPQHHHRHHHHVPFESHAFSMSEADQFFANPLLTEMNPSRGTFFV